MSANVSNDIQNIQTINELNLEKGIQQTTWGRRSVTLSSFSGGCKIRCGISLVALYGGAALALAGALILNANRNPTSTKEENLKIMAIVFLCLGSLAQLFGCCFGLLNVLSQAK